MRGTKIHKIVRNVPGIQKGYNFINRPFAPKDKTSIELKNNLKQELIPEIESLSKLIKKDLSFWYK